MDPLIKYNEKLDKYYKSIINFKYIFEVEKCCGYNVFVSIYKTNNMANLYSEVRNYFENPLIKDLFVFTETNEKFILPNDETILIRDFIYQNNFLFKPIYPLPASVVYKIHFDDGHVHT